MWRIVAAFGVGAVVVAGSVIGQHSDSDSVTTSTIVDGMTVNYPSTWSLILPSAVGSGPGANIAYLSCGPPVSALRPDGVLVTFKGPTTELTLRTHNRVLAGHEAEVDAVDPGASNCPSDATRALQARINLSNSIGPEHAAAVIVMIACYSGPDSARIGALVNTVVNSVAFT